MRITKMFLIFINIIRAEEEMRCFISISHAVNPPYILKVTANLIKEYFSSSRSVYISVLLLFNALQSVSDLFTCSNTFICIEKLPSAETDIIPLE